MQNSKILSVEEILEGKNVNETQIPFAKVIEEIPYKQRLHVARVYTLLFKTQNEFLPKLLNILKLSKNDLYEVRNIKDEDFKKYASQIDEKYRWITLWICLIVILSSGSYDSRVRVQIQYLSESLSIPLDVLCEAEDGIAVDLQKALHEMKDLEKQRSTSSKWKWALVGGAGLIGGGILLLTGGLTAPIILPAFVGLIGAIGATATAIGLSSIAAVATVSASILAMGGTVGIALLFGATGASLSSYHMHKRTEGIKHFKFIPLSLIPKKSSKNNVPMKNTEQDLKPGMEVYIGVSGMMYSNKPTAFADLWKCMYDVCPYGEHYALEWEPKVLRDLGNVINDFILSQVSRYAKKYWISIISTTLAAAMASIAIPKTILAGMKFVVNPWSMACDRAEKGGLLLAEILEKRIHGNRPVTLIGCSMGARLIFYCLEELERKKQFGIVENVFLIGGVISSTYVERWQKARSLVAGRFVNAYCNNDWILAYVYKFLNMTFDVAGLQEVNIDGIENVDLKGIVNGHKDYVNPEKMKQIVEKLEIYRSIPKKEDKSGTIKKIEEIIPELKMESIPEPQTETKTECKIECKTESKTECKTETNIETKTEPQLLLSSKDENNLDNLKDTKELNEEASVSE